MDNLIQYIMVLIYLDISSSNSASTQHARNHTTSLTRLHGHLNNLLNNTLASSTKRSYTSAFNRYIDFCKAHNLQEAPIIEYNLLLFITHIPKFIIQQHKSASGSYKAFSYMLWISSNLPTPAKTVYAHKSHQTQK